MRTPLNRYLRIEIGNQCMIMKEAQKNFHQEKFAGLMSRAACHMLKFSLSLSLSPSFSYSLSLSLSSIISRSYSLSLSPTIFLSYYPPLLLSLSLFLFLSQGKNFEFKAERNRLESWFTQAQFFLVRSSILARFCPRWENATWRFIFWLFPF